MRTVEITVQKVWKSQDDKCMFIQTPEETTYWTRKEDLFPNGKAGNHFWATVDDHEKSGGKITHEIVAVSETQEKASEEIVVKEAEVNPQEKGLAYKILAELYVNGFIDETKPDGKELVLRLKMWLKEIILGK